MNHLVTVARREALLSLGLAVLYMLGWWLSAYAVPANLMWHGWPLWFLLSCVFNPLLFVCLCALMVNRYFKVVALDGGEPLVSAANNAQLLPEYQTQTANAYATSSQSLKDDEPKLTDAAFPLPSSPSAYLRPH